MYLEYIQNSSSKSNQSCRQYPVDRLAWNYTLFWNYIPCLLGQGISFPGGRNLFHVQHKILISHLLPRSHRSCMSVYNNVLCLVLFYCYVTWYFSLKLSEVKSKVIEVKSYNCKVIEGSTVWPGLWKTLSFKTRLEICKIHICQRKKINTRQYHFMLQNLTNVKIMMFWRLNWVLTCSLIF